MHLTGPWHRIFFGLVLAVLVPLILLVGALLLTDTVLTAVDPTVVAVVVVAVAVAWAAILAIVFARYLGDAMRSMVDIARRGDDGGGQLDTAQRLLTNTLDERNRQVAALAREAAGIPIDEAPPKVARAIVAAARSVMGDPTWRCAVLTADDEALLRPGVYLGPDDAGEATAIGDLERWAAASTGNQVTSLAEGPWGAFAVVDLSVRDRLFAILYAPWEGRPAPSSADSAILSLVGQHASTALEHSLLYARVRSQADELDRLARVQSDFLRGVTHDLQTPLTSLGALATELRADPSLSGSAQSDLVTITQQAERLRRMVGQLLIASRLEAGAFEPQVEVFAVEPLVQRTWTALRAERPFELTVDGIPHLVVGDPGRVEQVLWALLDNAVKYSPPSSPIAVKIAPIADQLTIAVRDSGSGMDPETQARAFDQFYRSPQARRLAPDGSGVGLYAARGLIEAMDGTIALQTQLGAGTTVVIALPAEDARAGADEPAPAP